MASLTFCHEEFILTRRHADSEVVADGGEFGKRFDRRIKTFREMSKISIQFEFIDTVQC